MPAINTMDNTNWNTTSERRIPAADMWLVKFHFITFIAWNAER